MATENEASPSPPSIMDGQAHGNQQIKRTPPTPLSELNQPLKKFCAESGIHTALTKQAEGKSVGLMKWFTKCTPAECQAQSKRVDTMAEEALKEYKVMASMQTERRKEEVRERNKLRQQKHREVIYAAEIARGIRSPKGTKQKSKVSIAVSILNNLLTVNVRNQSFIFKMKASKCLLLNFHAHTVHLERSNT